MTLYAGYQEYIDYLRENIDSLVCYHSYAGTITSDLLQLKKELFHDDPFRLFDATIVASDIFAEKITYH